MNKSDFETKANKVAGAIAGIFIFYGVIVALLALSAFSKVGAIYGIIYLAVAFFVSLMGIFYKYVLNGIVHTMDQNKYIIQRQNEIEALVRRNQGNGYSNFGQSNNRTTDIQI